MAAFNGFPATYQPMFYPQMQQAYAQQSPAPMQPQSGSNGIIWVQGEAGAKSYLVAPNTTVQLWDSEAQTIYLKSADASGMPAMKVLDYTIRETGVAAPAISPARGDYVTHSELEDVTRQLKAMQEEISSMAARKKPVRLMKEDSDE